MSKIVKTGCIRQTLNEVLLEWRIPDFYRSKNTKFLSPVFCFSDSWWHLMIFPNVDKEHNDSVEVFLERKDSGPSKIVALCLGIKTTEGTKDLGAATYKVPDETGKVNVMGPFRFISKLNLMQQRSPMVPTDELTITCTLSTVDPLSLEASLCNRLWSLSQNLKKMLDDIDTDFTVKVDDKEFAAHRAILKGRCEYFAKLLEKEDKTKAEIRDMEEDVFECILTYLYTGEVVGISNEIAGKIYVAARKLKLSELKIFCVDYMKANLSHESVCEAVAIDEKYKEPELETLAVDYLSRHADQIFALDAWKKFKAENQDLVTKLLEKTIVERMELLKELTSIQI